MDTVSHGLWTYLLTGAFPKRRYSAILGSVYPDYPMILMFLAMLVQGKIQLTEPLMSQLFSHPAVYTLDSAWHSLILWTILLGAAIISQWTNLRWFVYGAYFHIGIDIVTHKVYVINYFWPLNLPTLYGLFDYRTTGFTIANIVLLILFLVWYKKIFLRNT